MVWIGDYLDLGVVFFELCCGLVVMLAVLLCLLFA